MKLTIPNLEISSNEGFAPEKDIFSRKGFGERLANLIDESNGNLVIALDAKWGEGKSTFIKMWRGYLDNERERKISSIYFDAFANDYQKDPFLALAAEMYGLIKDKSEEEKDEFKRKAGNAVKSMIRGGVKVAVRAVSGGVLDGSIVDSAEKDISKILADQVDEIISDKLKNTEKDKLAISQFRKYLENFSSKEGKPIVFIIDELDRCRPDFALDLIEHIKHLFAVKGITFLLVLNRNQLQEAIKFRYGCGVEAALYLQKFVNIWLDLPRKHEEHENHGEKYVRYVLKSMLNEGEVFKHNEAVELLYELVRKLKPSFREIEQILSYFALLQNMSGSSEHYPSYQMIFSLMCCLKVSKPELITQILRDDIDAKTLILEAMIDCGSDDVEFHRYYRIEYLTRLVTYDLSSESVRKKMLESKEIDANSFGRMNKNVIKTVCGWLSEISVN